MRRTALLLSLILIAATTLSAQGPPPPPPPPPPLGVPPVPAGNPITTAKTNLGKALFWDEQMSSTRTVACGTCHVPSRGGSDPRSAGGGPRATHPGADGMFGTADDIVGSPGVPSNLADGLYERDDDFGLRELVTGRKSPSAINAAYAPELFWDGRASGEFRDPLSGEIVLAAGGALESQILAPPVSAAEMAHAGRDWNDVAARIAGVKPLALSPSIPAALVGWIDGRDYPTLFAEAFGDAAVTPTRIALAIATYERTLNSNQAPIDLDAGGNPNALTQQERDGRNVFVASNCGVCHQAPLFSDNAFRYIGVRPAAEDLGRFEVTGANGDRGRMKVPSLRNVELRAPYFHTGRFATLEDVVDFYDRGGDFAAPNKDPNIVPLGLTAQQKTDLVAFLKRPLTDPRVAAQTAPFDRPLLYTESAFVPQFSGAGRGGAGGLPPMAIAFEPALAGNPSFTVGVDGALGSADAVLVIDDDDPGMGPTIPTAGSFARIVVPLAGVGAGAGWGSASLAIPNDQAALIGATLHGRWYVPDPAASGGVAVSRLFSVTVFGEATEAPDGSNWLWLR